MRVELHPEAEQEIEEALTFLDEVSSALASELSALLQDTLGLLAARPGIGAPLLKPPEAAGLRRHPLRKFHYTIIYEPIPGGIFVYALAHQRRRPGYWSRRLRP